MGEVNRLNNVLGSRQFIFICDAIWGKNWLLDISNVLELDPEMIERWANGVSPVPKVIAVMLADIAAFRASGLSRIAEELRKGLGDRDART